MGSQRFGYDLVPEQQNNSVPTSQMSHLSSLHCDHLRLNLCINLTNKICSCFKKNNIFIFLAIILCRFFQLNFPLLVLFFSFYQTHFGKYCQWFIFKFIGHIFSLSVLVFMKCLTLLIKEAEIYQQICWESFPPKDCIAFESCSPPRKPLDIIRRYSVSNFSISFSNNPAVIGWAHLILKYAF